MPMPVYGNVQPDLFPGGFVSSDLSVEYYYGAIPVSACGLRADLYGVAAFPSLEQGQKTQSSPGGEDPMSLIFDDEKLTVSQEENSADFTWEQMGRLDAKSSMYILYMDGACLPVPKETLVNRKRRSGNW